MELKNRGERDGARVRGHEDGLLISLLDVK